MDSINIKKIGKISGVSGQIALVECGGEYRPAIRELLTSPEYPNIRMEAHSYKSQNELYCLVLTSQKDIHRNLDIISTGTHLQIPVGKPVLGRIINLFGEVQDGGEKLADDTERRSIYGEDENKSIEGVAVNDNSAGIIETGIKAIDFFTPLPKGSKIGLVGGPGVGKTVLMTEIMRNINSRGNALSVFGGIGERIREGHELWKTLDATEVLYRTALIVGHMNENAAVRFKVAWAAATLGEYFRDVMKQDVLFFIDNIFRFVQAGSELSTLLGEIPSEFGYQSTLQTEVAQFEGRLKSTKEASITSIQTIYAPADLMTNPVIVDTMPHLASVIMLSRDIAHQGRFPAIDIMQSKSSVVDREFIGDEHYDALTKTVEVLNRYERLSRITAIIGEEELSVEDRKVFQRAQKIINYMTQPFFSTAPQTGRRGTYVDLKSVVNDVKLILQGRFDAVPSEQLLYVGDVRGAGFSALI